MRPREVCVCVCRYGNSPAANFSVILLHYFMQIIPRKDQHIKKNYKKMNAAHIGCQPGQETEKINVIKNRQKTCKFVLLIKKKFLEK